MKNGRQFQCPDRGEKMKTVKRTIRTVSGVVEA